MLSLSFRHGRGTDLNSSAWEVQQVCGGGRALLALRLHVHVPRSHAHSHTHMYLRYLRHDLKTMLFHRNAAPRKRHEDQGCGQWV
jgi:hypothetical protein